MLNIKEIINVAHITNKVIMKGFGIFKLLWRAELTYKIHRTDTEALQAYKSELERMLTTLKNAFAWPSTKKLIVSKIAQDMPI